MPKVQKSPNLVTLLSRYKHLLSSLPIRTTKLVNFVEFKKNGPSPASFSLFIFWFFSNNFTEKNCRVQRDSKPDHRSRRQASRPFERHHGPKSCCIPDKWLLQCPIKFRNNFVLGKMFFFTVLRRCLQLSRC